MTTEHEFFLVWSELGADEKRVMLVLAKRLLAGLLHYGRLSLSTDSRNWRQERAAELADALIYTAFAEVAATIQTKETR